MPRKIALFSKGLTDKTKAGLVRLIDALYLRKTDIFLNIMGNGTGDFVSDNRVTLFDDIESLPEDTYMIMSVGGDGTFLETAMHVKDLGLPVAGINTGRLGFLANISDSDISREIEMLCNGDFEIIERTMIEILSPELLFGEKGTMALNEVTVQKTDQHMITITVRVNGEFLNTFRADGLIISTATGSTAYNLSVGGPILSPLDDSIIIAPMSPHNLTVRPIILPGGSLIEMETGGRGTDCMVTCDSKSVTVPLGVVLKLKEAAAKLQTVTTRGNDFFTTLRNKLMWGADLRN